MSENKRKLVKQKLIWDVYFSEITSFGMLQPQRLCLLLNQTTTDEL